MMEDHDSRRVRKEEAKREKRKRIEEAGGKRPRSSTTGNNRIQKDVPSKKTKKQQHRFGRVMEQVPSFIHPSRSSTLSIAIPGSVVSNAQTKELRTHLVGQIARAAAIYHVDEIIVYDDKLSKELPTTNNRRGFYHNNNNYNNHNRRNFKNDKNDGEENTNTTNQKNDGDLNANHKNRNIAESSSDPHEFMARVLQYCECPQYLRRFFFSMHPDLQFGGLLPPLDAPHHVRLWDKCKYREGIVLDKTGKQNGGSLVNCGIRDRPVE